MKRNYFASISLIVSLGSMSTFASAQPEKNFEERKAQHLKEIDEKIQKMQEHRNCVANTNSVDDLKKCRASMQEFHKSEKIERLENRKKSLEKKIDEIKK